MDDSFALGIGRRQDGRASTSFIALAAGRPDEALLLAERANAIERGSTGEEASSLRPICQSHLLLGQYAEGVRAGELSAARDNWWVDQAWLIAGYLQQGDMAKAAVAKSELLKQQPRFTIDKLKRIDAASTNPPYLQRAGARVYTWLRKAGLPDR